MKEEWHLIGTTILGIALILIIVCLIMKYRILGAVFMPAVIAFLVWRDLKRHKK